MGKRSLSVKEKFEEIFKRREACQADYSKWLDTISDQMPNDLFAKQKEKKLRQLSKKYKLTLDTVVAMFPN